MGISLAGAILVASAAIAQSTSYTPQLNIWAEFAGQPADDVYQIDLMMTVERVNFGSAEFIVALHDLTLTDRPDLGIEPIWHAENPRVSITFTRGCRADGPLCGSRPRWEFNEAMELSSERLKIAFGVTEGVRGPDSIFTGELFSRLAPEVDSALFLNESGLPFRPVAGTAGQVHTFAVEVPGDLETASTLFAAELEQDDRIVWAQPGRLNIADRRLRSGRDEPVLLGSLFVELTGPTAGRIDLLGLDWQRNLDGVLTPIDAPFITTGLTIPTPASLTLLLPACLLTLRKRPAHP